jgi:hypothetical protein
LHLVNRLNHGLSLSTLSRKFLGPIIFWMGSYLTGRTQRVRVGDYLSDTIDDVLGFLKNVWVLAYYVMFQQGLDGLQGVT